MTQGSLMIKNSTKSKLDAKIEKTENSLSITLPILTKSEANCFEPWQTKHKRHKAQQRLIAYALNPHKHLINLPCSLTLTRLAPHTLDAHDNLPMSFKYITDAICAIITGNHTSGKADSDPRISIAYSQTKSTAYGIKIDIIF